MDENNFYIEHFCKWNINYKQNSNKLTKLSGLSSPMSSQRKMSEKKKKKLHKS